MLTYEMKDAAGFDVFHNSVSWRIAAHTYESSVNGMESFVNWGIHETSEEAFLLLKGKGWLVTSCEGRADDDYHISELKTDRLCVVEKAERHAIILSPGSQALIVENRDMSASRTEPVSPAVMEAVRKLLD